MRFIIFLGLLLSSGFAACSQDINAKRVPALVNNALMAKFPNAVDIEWEKKKNLYEADYDVNQTEFTALIDASGNIVMYKQDIPVTEIPAVLSGTLQKSFADYKVDDAEKIQKDGKIFFQVQLEKNNQELKKVFAEDGQATTAITYWD
ncbi:hypothetical protein [Adhaeribacter rhizoryzae]|uniref:Uncharacterized protein n=1 Tax=Adhaeribacter rhizoryzae TaxID=2607907 RepID=A0A5M6D2H0_9BACT|nr:hypothetical protein [Adhaeribacter rhizoryzae]KAA5541684.1 hypothetical protein F0145_20155 [Adhaeribacter rhizoryzae]